MRSLFLLTFRRILSPTRLLMLAGLALAPLVVTMIMLAVPNTMSLEEFERSILNAMLAGAIIPLATLATARAGFGDEISDRSLANVTLTPYPRWKIVLPKLLAVTAVPAVVIALTAALTSYMAYGADLAATRAVTTGAVAAVLVYSSLVVWLDLMTPHAVGIGLAYIVVWEGLFSRFIFGVRFLSVRSHSLAIIHGVDDRRFGGEQHTAVELSVAVAVVLIAVLFVLSVRRLRTMDVP